MAATSDQLEKALNWAFENESKYKLAFTYLQICSCIHHCDPDKLETYEAFGESAEEDADEAWIELDSAHDKMFEARDRLAALISSRI